MMTVNEVSKLTGVSIRALQYYDKIGLLHPAEYTEAGYRLYDDTALERLQQILLFRELEFSLKEIQSILQSPDFDRDRALDQQICLLTLKKEHMSNGSMFAHLEKFKSKDFWSEHRMITFNTLTDKQEYEIVAVFRTVVYTDSPEAFKFYRFIDAESANEFDDFIAKCKELSFYDTGVTAEYGDKLITLSTCEYSRNNSRLVVVAKRITEDGGADAAKTHAEATAEGERPN